MVTTLSYNYNNNIVTVETLYSMTSNSLNLSDD